MYRTKQDLLKLAAVVVVVMTMALPVMASDECKAVYGNGTHTVRLATGSPGELGILKVIAGAFNAKYDTKFCWRKAGSGKSLQLLKSKEVDVVMVHAPAAEKKAVEEGWAIKRELLGSNEFYIVGPKDDPANIDFIVSEEGQRLIRDYGVKEYGESLYNDAEYAKQYDH